MKHLAKGFVIAFAIGVCLFGVAAFLLVTYGQKDLLLTALFLIPAPFMFGPKIAQVLERDEGRKSIAAGRRKPVYDFGSFRIAWPLMVVYGTVTVAGILSIGSFLLGVLLGYLAGEKALKDDDVLFALALIPFSAGLFAMYFVGRWIGTRCSRYGIATVLLVALCTSCLLTASEWLSLSDEMYKQVHQWERTSPYAFLPIVFQFVTLSATGLVGYWRGYRHRLSKYFSYLLSVLPSDTRAIVVALAYQEAQKVAAAAVARASLERAGVIAKV